jgi:hypothetical protein
MIGQSRTRLLGLTVLVAMFATGGLTGAVLQRTVLADNKKPAQPAHGPSLFEQLKLTDAQQTQVCTILERQQQEMSPHVQAFKAAWADMERLKQEHKPAVDSIVSATYEELDALLTPEQRATKDRFREERKKYFAAREAKDKEQRAQGQSQGQPQGPGGPRREGERGGRPNPMNPLGVSCPGLDSVSRGGPRP